MANLLKKKYLVLTILFVLVISLSNFWIYWIYEYDFFLGELLIIEAVLLFLSTLSRKTKAIPIFIFVILFLSSSILLINHFDKDMFSTSNVESIHIEERRHFYANELGKIYKNRVGIFYFDNLRLIFSKISSNFFSALDLGLYFSPGLLIELGKYPLTLAPFFIMGFLSFVINLKVIPTIYFAVSLFISSFTNLDAKVGPLLIFPIISLCIALGLVQFLTIVKNHILNKTA